jgi:Flp pilus assembly pilin Flp
MYQFLQDEQGTAALEYSLLISLVGLVMVGALHMLGGNLFEIFSFVSEEFDSAPVIDGSDNPN